MKHHIQTIEHFRKLNDITKDELCEKAGISKTMYWRYVTGKSALSLEIACKLAESVGLRFDLTLNG